MCVVHDRTHRVTGHPFQVYECTLVAFSLNNRCYEVVDMCVRARARVCVFSDIIYVLVISSIFVNDAKYSSFDVLLGCREFSFHCVC